MAEMSRIDRYEVESVLGAGAFATVWLARDPVLDLRVAIKVLADNWSRDPGIRARFLDEARVLWQADSTRIVRVHHVGELDDGRPYFVMAWADRGNLRELMDNRFASGSAFSVAETASIAAELCRAVADVHGLGRIHRDIKPANVLLRSTQSRRATPIHGLGPDEQLVLADFGLAREIEASTVTMVSGSPAYVAPEQAGGDARLDERADIYPLGLILIELATGSSPARRSTMIDAAITGRLDVAGHVAAAASAMPPAMLDLAARMVEPDPNHRPASAADLANHLDQFAAEGTGGPPGQVYQPVPSTWAPPGGSGTSSGGATGRLEATDVGGARPGNPVVSDPPVGAGRSNGAGSGSGGGVTMGLVALGGLVVVGLLGGIGYLATAGGDDDATTTTTATSASTDTTSTTAPGPTTIVRPDGVDPISVPLPPFSQMEPGADDIRQVANVALTLADTTAFYQELDDPDWSVVGVDEADDEVTIEMAGTYRTATVQLSRAAVTAAADGITRIEVRYSSP